MNTTFIITGGAGRVVTSIPALEKYHRLNPEDNFNVIVHGWHSLFWSHPSLQHRVIDSRQKGTFDRMIRDTQVVVPEPYQVHGFYNQKLHMAEAFDQEINHTNDHSDLNYNCLYLSNIEYERTKEIVEKYKKEKQVNKFVVFQPYGSTVDLINGKPIDHSNRSMIQDQSTELIQRISKSAVVFNVSYPKFRDKRDTHSVSLDNPYADYLRLLMGLIYHCDLFVGCDSAGQHIARTFNKPGIILMGGTDEINCSYPDNFTIIRKKNRLPVYSPLRISDIDAEFANRLNDGAMCFSKDEFSFIIDHIDNYMNDTKESAPVISGELSYE